MNRNRWLRRLLPCVLLLICSMAFAAMESAAEGPILADIDSVHREENGWSVSFYLSDNVSGANAWCARFDGSGRFLGAEKEALTPGMQTLHFDVANASALFMVLDDSMTPLCGAKRAGYIGKAVPISYEVHLLLDSSQVLDENHYLKKEIQNENIRKNLG